jgi:hypothetical protein
MKLGLAERVSLSGILPDESNYATLRSVWIMRQALAPSTDEVKKFEIKYEGNMITWNEEGKAYVAEIPFNDEQFTMVKQALVDLDSKKKLNTQNFSLFEKFVMEYKAS